MTDLLARAEQDPASLTRADLMRLLSVADGAPFAALEAAARLLLPTCNIAAATALQALQDDGRERGLRAGANVVMPNITDRLYRADYQLYENKPCIGEDPLKCRGCLEARIRLASCTVAWHTPGTPKHYQEAQ